MSRRTYQVLARTTVIAVALIVITSVPFAVFAAISGQVGASSAAVLGGAAVLGNLMYGGRAIAYLTVGLLTALTPLAIVSGAVPVAGAALMALMCFGVGLSAARGLHRGTLLIPMYLSFLIIAPPLWSGSSAVDRTSTSYLLWIMLFYGGGALWAALVFPPLLRKFKMPPLPRPKPWAWADTMVYTITITILCTACTLAVLIWWPRSDGAWLVVTVLAVTQLGQGASVKRTLARIPGTVVGVAIAATVAAVSGSEAVVLGIALVLGVILVVLLLTPHSYFLWTVVVTPTMVLFNSTGVTNVDKTDAERLWFTLTAAALILLASGIALWWAHYQQTHSGSPADSQPDPLPQPTS